MFDELIQELADTGSVQFYVRAVPNAPQTKVLKVMADESVKIAVADVPEKGKANAELLKFLTREFGGDVKIISGKGARMKIIRVRLSGSGS